ncbi:MAG: hypothetical protein ACKVG7_00610 [Flavobacteriales bacterium]|jgi:hypothetical protein
MSEKKISSFEKIGFQKVLPKGSDLNNFETISVTTKNGEIITLYRDKDNKNEIDETTNFKESWNVFNSLL